MQVSHRGWGSRGQVHRAVQGASTRWRNNRASPGQSHCLGSTGRWAVTVRRQTLHLGQNSAAGRATLGKAFDLAGLLCPHLQSRDKSIYPKEQP